MRVTLTDAVEQALADLGVDADAEQVKKWVIAKYGEEYFRRFAGSTLKSTVFVVARRRRTRLREAPEPTIAEAASVRQLIAANGITLDDAELYLPVVGELLERVGSADKLRRVLAFLRQFDAPNG
jgi:GGDEF domain-containing protein